MPLRGGFNLDCPWCSPGWGHFRLGYNPRGNYFSCWSCGPKKMWSVLREIAPDLTGTQVTTLIKGLDRVYKVEEEFPTRGRLELPDGVQSNPPLSRRHRRYLKGRGFNCKELIKLWQVRGIKWSKTHPWRIYIPIHYKGEVVSWTTRSLSDKVKSRYLTASPHQEVLNHRHLLYGEDYVRNCVIVCEGPLDVWKIGYGAVCTFGTAFSRQQVNRLTRFPSRVICFDNERAAQHRAKKLVNQLEVFPGDTYNVVLESGKDPGEADETELAELRDQFLF